MSTEEKDPLPNVVLARFIFAGLLAIAGLAVFETMLSQPNAASKPLRLLSMILFVVSMPPSAAAVYLLTRYESVLEAHDGPHADRLERFLSELVVLSFLGVTLGLMALFGSASIWFFLAFFASGAIYFFALRRLVRTLES